MKRAGLIEQVCSSERGGRALTRYLAIILREFLEVCLFRKGPQDLPASTALCWSSAVSYAAVSAVIALPTQSPVIAALSGITETVILFAVSYLFLYLRSVPRRWIQVATTLAGAGIIFSLMILPLYFVRVYINVDPGLQDLITTLIIFIWFWNIAVMSHILKHAFSSSYVLAALGALAYVAIIMMTLQQLFPINQTT